MLKDNQINELKNIVGEQWVNGDRSMMDTYSYYMNPEILNEDGSVWLPRPEAVVLPQTAEEVAEIMKLARREKLLVKPLSTGWSATAACSRENVIVLDLKRMDKIIDIDYKNRIAVVEPYVKAIILQTMLWKEGLNLHVVSCGGNHSPLASATSAWGTGLDGPSMSYSGRNLLGAEWVLPTGEILRLGSAETGAGWFTADGPGPSLRGVMRGYIGAFGGLGVFTKAALKLYSWHGPAEIETGGESPQYTIGELPPNMGLFMMNFPNEKALADAGYLLGEAEITYADFRLPAFMTALGATDNNLELKRVWESGLFQKTAQWNLIAAVIGASRREYEWKLKALKEILKEVRAVRLPLNMDTSEKAVRTAGKLARFMSDPLKLLRLFPFLTDWIERLPMNEEGRQRAVSSLFWVLLRHANNVQGNFRPSQAMFTSLGGFDTWDMGLRQSDWIAQKKREYIERGAFLDDGGDLGCGGTFEHAHMGYMEGIGLYTTKNAESVKAAGQVIEEAVNACVDEAFGTPIAGFGRRMNDHLGPHCGDYHLWMAKLKQVIDPDCVADPFFYTDRKTGE